MSPRETEGPSDPKLGVTLPLPIEIAKIAAILSRGRNSEAGDIDDAIKLFLRAAIRCEELDELSLDQIAEKVGDRELLDLLSQEAGAIMGEKRWADTLELDPEKDDDPARQFLATQGVARKSGQSVLENVRR